MRSRESAYVDTVLRVKPSPDISRQGTKPAKVMILMVFQPMPVISSQRPAELDRSCSRLYPWRSWRLGVRLVRNPGWTAGFGALALEVFLPAGKISVREEESLRVLSPTDTRDGSPQAHWAG